MIREKFDQVWLDRINQRLDSALIGLAELRSPVATSQNLEYRQELRLLEASLYRARGELARSKEFLAALEAEYLAAGLPFPTRFLLERGLNSFLEQNYSASFDDFLAVVARRKLENNSIAIAQAAMNTLICAEFLGLKAKTFEDVFRELSQLVDFSLAPGIQSQWEAYQIRQLWAEGNFAKLNGLKSRGWNQPTYSLLFLKHLPFVKENFQEKLEISQSLSESGEPYLRNFCTRTLLAQSHPGEIDEVKATELVDRLYLWTWYWLCSKQFPIERLKPILEVLLKNLTYQRLTAFDQELLDLALGWLSIFLPSLESYRQDILPMISLGSGDHVVSGCGSMVELERLLQGWVRSHVNDKEVGRRDFARAIEEHPLFQNKFLLFRDLYLFFKAGGESSNGRLKDVYARCMDRMHEIDLINSSQVLVNMEQMIATNKRSKESIESEPLCLAIQILSKGSSVTCAEFLQGAFAQVGYDAFLHSPRIFNLLARIRNFLPPEFEVIKRGDWIRTRGPWDRIKISGEGSFRIRVKQKSGTPSANAKSTQTRPFPRLFKELSAIGQRAFSRRDMEKRTELSRASANRLLQEWLRDGVVEIQGSGPARKYIVSPKWRMVKT